MPAPNRAPLVDPQTGVVTSAWLDYFINLENGTGLAANFTNVTINRSITGAGSGLFDVSIDAFRLTGTTLAPGVINSSLSKVATLLSGATGAGFTIDLLRSTVTGNLGWANLPTGAGTWTAQPTIIGLLTVNGGIRVLDDIQPQVNFRSNLGSLTSKFLTLWCAELFVETLVAQDVMATIGGRVLVGPTTSLTADLAPAATTITVKHNNLANGHRVRLEANGQIEWMAITSAASGTAGLYVYSVTRNLDGTGANQWYLGDAVFNTGTTGNGFIDLYSIAGVLSGAGPTIVGNVRTGTTYSQIAPRWAIGNLNGVYGYVAEAYGAAFGDAAATNVTIDATNGFRIRSGTTIKLQADTTGNLNLVGNITMGTAGSFISGATGFSTGTGIWLDYNGGTPRFRIGTVAGNRVTWDGTNLTVFATNVTIDASGLTLGDSSSFSAYQATSALKFTRPSVNQYGQTGDRYGVFTLASGSDEDLYVANIIKGNTTASGKASVYIEAQGWNSGGGGSATTDTFIRVRSEIGVSAISLSADTVTAGGAFSAPTNTTHTFGAGGTSGNAVLAIDGGSGAGIGGFLQFKVNGTVTSDIGQHSAITGTGTSGDLVYYSASGLGHVWLVNGSITSAMILTTGSDLQVVNHYSWTGDTDTYMYNDVANRICFTTGGSQRMFIDGANQVFPGTDNAVSLGVASFRWSVVYAVNGTIQTSDARLKTAITETALGAGFLQALRPVDYRWRSGGGVRHGFLAQEVAAVAPSFGGLHYDGDGVADGLDYAAFVAPLVAGFQHHEARLRALEARP